ncbi:MAG: DUF4351 domain-containing protein [Magnetococcales bacterium]|nr:DUF4351 domain-containing protein [Magnetococcales bacterium]
MEKKDGKTYWHCLEGTLNSPETEGITPEYVIQLGKEWFELMVDATPEEELFSLPKFERRLEQEHQDGEREGEAKILTRQLQRRFGELPPWVYERIAKAELSALEDLSLKLLDAKSLGDIFSDTV